MKEIPIIAERTHARNWAYVLKIKGDEWDPKLRRVSTKYRPSNEKQSLFQSSGYTGIILNELCMSTFAIEHPRPAVQSNFTASSNLEYFTLKSSFGIPSFIARPRGLDRSKISLHIPSGFLTAPKGEHCVTENGGCKRGPEVLIPFALLY